MPLSILLSTLDRLNFGAVLLGVSGTVLESNEAADRILKGLHGSEQAPVRWSRECIKALVKFGDKHFTLDHDRWVVVELPDRRPLVIHALHCAQPLSNEACTVLILLDLEERSTRNSAAIAEIFSLTGAEHRLAHELSIGKTLREAAEASGTSLATVRSQLGSLFRKTSTVRQSELVALLARFAIVP